MWLPWTLVSRDIQGKLFLSTWITAVSSWVAILSSPVRVMTLPPLDPVPMGDSPYLEEKNNLVTLKFVEYDCYDSQEKVDLLNRL